MSKYQRARRVQPSDVEVQSHAFTSRKQNRQIHSSGDEGVGRAIKKSEVDQRNGGGRQVIVLDKSGIDKAVSRAAIDQSPYRKKSMSRRANLRGGEGNGEGMRVGKSGRVESDTL